MKRILFYGDSNTYGYDPCASVYEEGRYPKEVRWVNILRGYLADSWEILDDGVNGRCIPESAGQLNMLHRSLKKYAPIQDLAIMLGTNDILNQTIPDPALIAEKLRSMVHYIQSVFETEPEFYESVPDIVIIAPPDIRVTGGAEYETGTSKSWSLSEAYRKIAQSEHLRFIDAAAWNPDLSFDGIHLTEKGHRQFADHMMKSMLCSGSS